ncbi:MAG: SGNH/GDSL hydrolase family protein [Steroidobacter sp.]
MTSASAAHSTTADVAVGALPGARDALPQTAVHSRVSMGRYVFLLLQLGLLAIALRQFQIENAALLRISLLGFSGFAVHYFLPFRWRLPFFAALSIGGLFMVMGAANTLWMLAFGLALILICHLPLSFGKRVALLLLAGGLLALMRLEIIPGPWSRAIWPILGAMFMFRLAVYMYDLKHDKTPPSSARALAYFFPLPNVCFPMFPVLDYKGFGRCYYDVERHRIYQVGIDWMARGVLHLILYRAVNYYFTVAPAEVIDPDTLVQHIVANFMLYLRISGTFHLITGMLHLFGFNLLETHKRYVLSSTFTDFWRRINIYWKDFMMKLFYYPVFFRLKRYGQTTALVLATIIVFAATWLLHSYQWFWLRGEFPIAWQDAVFWLTLAVFVVANSLREIKHGRARSLTNPPWSLASSLTLGLRTAAMFLFICVLWSIWTCESLGSWLSMWEFLWRGVPEHGEGFPKLLLAVVGVIVAAVLWYSRVDHVQPVDSELPGQPLAKSTLITVIGLAIMAAVGVPGVYSNLGVDTANTIVLLRSGNLSRADAALLERGYYEDLTRVNRFNSELWQLYMNRPVFHWLDVLQGGGLGRMRADFLQQELVPGFKAETPYGQIQTNRWGMRDKDYDLAPPAGAYRIAVLGASTIMGWGVEDEDSFVSLTEKGLNETFAGRSVTSVEVLNLSVPGYFPPQQAMAIDKALEFSPDAVFFMATGREFSRSINFLADILAKGVEIPYPELNAIIARAGIESRVDATTAVRRLTPHRDAILAWLYNTLVQKSHERGVMPVWIFVPQSRGGDWVEETAPAERIATQAGFKTVNMSEVFVDTPIEQIRLAEWDEHPNKLGHRMLADALLKELTREDSPTAQAIAQKGTSSSEVTAAP